MDVHKLYKQVHLLADCLEESIEECFGTKYIDPCVLYIYRYPTSNPTLKIMAYYPETPNYSNTPGKDLCLYVSKIYKKKLRSYRITDDTYECDVVLPLNMAVRARSLFSNKELCQRAREIDSLCPTRIIYQQAMTNYYHECNLMTKNIQPIAIITCTERARCTMQILQV